MAATRGKRWLARKITLRAQAKPGDLRLEDGSRVAVVGGGPAGSFFSYFFLEMAERVNSQVPLDLYEWRDFSAPGPAGCNMCGGIVSEALVQTLAAEGINLPPTVVQRGIDSYVLHMDTGSVHISTPVRERRIAAVHRGAGPRGIAEAKWQSFDGYLIKQTVAKGAHLISKRVEGIEWEDGRPRLQVQGGSSRTYDLLVVAVGVNSATLKVFEGLQLHYQSPRTTKTYICEFCLGYETVSQYLGSSMHVFLLNVPRLEFAALIPKGDYVTVCLLGQEIDAPLVKTFLDAPEVRECFPPDWSVPKGFCHCSPRINIQGAVEPFADRIVFLGDCAVTRLYKDGIGAAYRTAKAAAQTAVFAGVSGEEFRRNYWPVCQALTADNRVGEVIFAVTRLMQKIPYAGRGVLSMVSREQQRAGSRRRMSMVLWDVFTGNAPYRDILLRTLNPFFLLRFLWNILVGIWSLTRGIRLDDMTLGTGALGKAYEDGEIILRQGELGGCMYVIQEGQVEVLLRKEEGEIRVALLNEGEFFGEMALFEPEVRSATVRAVGPVRVLTVDKRTLLARIHQDPSLAFRIVQSMSKRIRNTNEELIRTRAQP